MVTASAGSGLARGVGHLASVGQAWLPRAAGEMYRGRRWGWWPHRQGVGCPSPILFESRNRGAGFAIMCDG